MALLSVKVADVRSFFFPPDFYKTFSTARLLFFNFMFSLQEARLLLPGQREEGAGVGGVEGLRK